MSTKKIALYACFSALAMIIGFVESMLPPIIPALPFIRIGLSNVIILVVLLIFNLPCALTISLIKSILIPIFIGNPLMIAYSLPASLISVLVSYFLLLIRKNSLPFISIISALFHNFIQLLVAYLIIDFGVFAYIPYLTFLSISCGFLVGLVATFLFKAIIKNNFYK